MRFILPGFVFASFAAFFLWWGAYFPPETNVEIVIAYLPLLIISAVSLLARGNNKNRWNLVIAALIVLEALVFILRPYYINYQMAVKEPILAAHLEEAYPGEPWRLDITDPHRGRYSFHVIFENEPEITYFYHVGKDGMVTRTGYSGWKEGPFKHTAD